MTLFFVIIALLVGMSLGGALRDSIWRDRADSGFRMESAGRLFCVTRDDACTWTEGGPDGIWDTDCGNAFTFFEGGPEHNGFTHCPYCGKRIKNPLPL